MNCDSVFAVLTRGPFPTGDPSDEAVEAHLSRCADCRRLAEALRPAARVRDDLGVRSPDMIGRMVEEIDGSEERRSLPGYWGEASSEAAGEILARFSDPGDAIVERQAFAAIWPAAETRSLQARLFRRRFFSAWFSRLWMFGLAMLIGAGLGCALQYWRNVGDPPLWGASGHRVAPVHSQQDASFDHPRLLATNHQLLANEHLPAVCTAAAPRSSKMVRGSADSPPAAPSKHSLASFTAPVEHQVCCTQCHHAGADRAIPAAASVVRNNCKMCHGDMPRTAADSW